LFAETLQGHRLKIEKVEPSRIIARVCRSGLLVLLPPDYPLKPCPPTEVQHPVVLERVNTLIGSPLSRSLSTYDKDFIRMLYEGKSNQEIARALRKSPRTVSTRKVNLFKRLKKLGKTLEEFAKEIGAI